ncbi:MAG: TauD/TfdA family dioxygenase [Candidatus Competibacteraceae bacterium]|nr:TauD/TfdA family dioxygenase [Candidatus Competibacteraceae bacterium]
MTNLADIPEFLAIPAAWTGAEISQQSAQWRWTLTPAELVELEQAGRRFMADYGTLAQMTAAHFPLPGMQSKLSALRQTLIQGIGFEVIRGLPVERLGTELASTIFCGIGAHLGSTRSQNAQGHLLGHVRDQGANSQDPNIRIYQTNERQTFHTDSADVVALLCLNEARQGGDSLLVSAVTIYNTLRRQRPDLLPYLFDAIATDRRGEIPPGGQPFFTIPVFNWHAGFLTVMYQRQYIDSAQRFATAPRLTERHIEALDYFDALANDAHLHISMRLAPGDMQFVYNHSLLHDRTGFTDWDEPDRRRHLLRLWLAIPGDRPLPACFAQRYGSLEIGNRGGVIVEQVAAPG